MSQTLPERPEADAETLGLRQANAEARALLADVVRELRAVLQDEVLMEETPIEVWIPMESAAEAIGKALRRLDAVGLAKDPLTARSTEGLTRRQGQFLAYIREGD